MAAPIEFQIRILGGAAGELKAIGGGFGGADKEARKAAAGVKVFEAEVGDLKGSIGGLEVNLNALGGKGSIFSFDLAGGIRSAVELVTTLIGKVISLGSEMAHVAGEAEDLNLAIKLKVGEEGARGVDALAELFSGRTRYDDSEIKRAVLPLLDIGLNDGKGLLTDLTTIAADLETRSAGRLKLAESMESFAQLALKGQISPKVLSGLGIGTEEYFSALAGRMKVDVATAKNRAKKGKVEAEFALQTLVAVVGARQGGTIGSAALAGGQTLGASLARLANLQGNLYEELAGSPGMKAVQRVIDRFVDVLGGPTGKRIMEQVGGVFEKMFGGISQEKMIAFLERIPGVLEGVLTAIELAVRGGLAIGDAMNESVSKSPIEVMARVVGKAFVAGVKEGLFGEGGLREAGGSVAKDLALGFVEHIPLAWAGKAMYGLGQEALASLRKSVDAHSPSRATMAIGADVVEGFARGMEGGGGRVTGAASRTLGRTVIDAIQPTGGGLMGGGGGSASIYAPITITESSSPRETAAEVRIEMMKLLAEAGLKLGVPLAPAVPV